MARQERSTDELSISSRNRVDRRFAVSQSPEQFYDDIGHISPDAFSGALWALDGIKDGLMILNGPTGCKFYHASVSNSQYCRGVSYNPARIDEVFFFRQNRIPCTYLDGNDFVYGAEEKLRKALRTIAKKNHRFVAVVNSPGAALIGDNLEGILSDEIQGLPRLAIENAGYSESFYKGFQKTSLALLDCLEIQKLPCIPQSVNLIGFSIYQKHYEGNIIELKRLLTLAGIRVICTPMAACSCDELKMSVSAAMNIVVAPEAGQDIAQWYADKHDIPYLALPAPMGFDGTERWIRVICGHLETDHSEAIEDLNYGRAVSFRYLQGFNSLSGYPKGTFYGVKSDYSIARGLYHFLTPYLGMLPSAIEFFDTPGENLQAIFHKELSCKNLEACLKPVHQENYHMLFADGNSIAQQKAQQKTFAGVEVSLPSLGYTDVIPKAVLGTKGALYLIEQVINGLKFFCK